MPNIFSLVVFTIIGRGSMRIEISKESVDVTWWSCFKEPGRHLRESYPASVEGLAEAVDYVIKHYLKFKSMAVLNPHLLPY